jgi:hypothetical protein
VPQADGTRGESADKATSALACEVLGVNASRATLKADGRLGVGAAVAEAGLK